jgi:hypothetical protein|tara:strand:- start:281 stop:2095 length:1815 start_codon:yes stop_codon:yes gene_type:complete
MAVGKIASSTANYSTLGKTSVKNQANGFSDMTQFTDCEVFAPSLNLGVSVINTVAPATQGYTNYTQGPGIEGGVGYAPTFTENNITIVKPDSLPTNPAFADGRSFDRYETNFLEMARGLSSSVIIGGDLFTVQDFYKGGLNTPQGYFSVFGSDNNIIGQSNFRGSTATSQGYPTSFVRSSTIMGAKNYNLPLRSDGNFAYIYPDYGYSLGYDKKLDTSTIFGFNNGNTLNGSGYSEATIDSIIIGNNNFSWRDGENSKQRWDDEEQNMNGSVFVPRLNEKQNIILGNNNYHQFAMNNPGGFDGGAFNAPVITSRDNILIGRSNSSYESMTNHIPQGGNFPGNIGNGININRNVCIGDRINLRARAEISPSSESTASSTEENTIVGGYHTADNSNKNVFFGNRIAAGNESRSFDNANGWSNLYGNTIIGNRAMQLHGVAFNETNTNFNTIIGHEAQDLSTGLVNCTIIGYQSSASTTNASNEITLGNSSISALRCNVTSITSLSDARDKANIEPISNASAFIKDLKPVKFDWNRRDGVKAKEHDIGFLAQDLDEAQSKHGIQEHLDIVYKSNPEALEASYGKLLPILVQALKEQQEEIEKLKSTN